MSEQLTLDLAVSRYKQGKCPQCGKGQGASKGLEKRKRIGDIYCHSCKRSWPLETNEDDMASRISITMNGSTSQRTVSFVEKEETLVVSQMLQEEKRVSLWQLPRWLKKHLRLGS